jgi:hypothetical protein
MDTILPFRKEGWKGPFLLKKAVERFSPSKRARLEKVLEGK